MAINQNSIEMLENLLLSLQDSINPNKKPAKNTVKNQEINVPVNQALHFAPHWTEEEATKRSHIISYRDSVTCGPLTACFEFKSFRKLFWTGLRASWTRNVPAKYCITALSYKTNMKYTLYDFQEIPIGEWVFLPSVIPAFDNDDYKLFIEFEIPKECSKDKTSCNLTVRMVGFEELIEIGDKQCILVSYKYGAHIVIYDIEDWNFARMYLPCCDTVPYLRPNSTVLPNPISME